ERLPADYEPDAGNAVHLLDRHAALGRPGQLELSMSLAALALAPGLALGSFLNVVAARVPLRRSLVSPGSSCMSCGHEIAWYDNVPILSYALLRGRCRACGVHIPVRYPAVELVAGLLFAASFWKFGRTGTAAVA